MAPDTAATVHACQDPRGEQRPSGFCAACGDEPTGSATDTAKQRWFERLTLFALGTVGTGLSMLCTLVAWAAFGWRDAILTFAAVIGGFFWAFALGEFTHRG